MSGRLRILQVNRQDVAGGAAQVARSLFAEYRARGHESWLAVGRKASHDPHVLAIPRHEISQGWSRVWPWVDHQRLRQGSRSPALRLLRRLMTSLDQPGRTLDHYLGVETYRFPGSRRLLHLTPSPPDIMHCHNLHGEYFDLRHLPVLSAQVPTVLTLHDAWLLSGHCAHSFDCERWKIGCGHCPDLTIRPAIRRDATAFNWKRKQRIFSRSALYVATPCAWLMRKVEQSILSAGAVDMRIIPYGVDRSIFTPLGKDVARDELGIPQDVAVLLFAANGIRANIWKDYSTLRAVIGRLGQCYEEQDLLLIALGEDAPTERFGRHVVRFVPYQHDRKRVARYYQAADVYVHPARVDTFPNTVLEALACGTPVVATAVGGIPEQVVSLDGCGLPSQGPSGRPTGALVPPGDAAAMVSAIELLLRNERLRHTLSVNAANDAALRFDSAREVDDYLGWYTEILAAHQRHNRRPQTGTN